MLRKLLNRAVSLSEAGGPLHPLRPLIKATDSFFYEEASQTTQGPHIRDFVDLKRWMSLVVIALIPCVFMAVWNTGIQKFVYSSFDKALMEEFLSSAESFTAYKAFALKEGRLWTILSLGLQAFLPVLFISYAVGGFWEVLFACIRRHPVAEGFLVTGIIYPLLLPPTIPYWMVAVGVSAGVIISKELFGGTGMNIVNPALACRAFLFFSFPIAMSGNVFVGTNPAVIRESLTAINRAAVLEGADGFTQATALAHYHIPDEIRRIHIDALAAGNGLSVGSSEILQKHLEQWNAIGNHHAALGQLSGQELREFVCAPLDLGGLGLNSDSYSAAQDFFHLQYGVGHLSDMNLFLGNKLGSFGETSVLACLIGALFLIITGVGSFRKMAACGVGAFATAALFQLFSHLTGPDGGLWNAARYSLPAYKHLLVGGLAFGAVFMVTDPVSGPSMKLASWVYGLFIGSIAIIIREINPAYSEGVMLAILLGNVFAPLFDHYAALIYRRGRYVPE